MKHHKYEGHSDDMQYKEGVLTLLEDLIAEIKEIRGIITPKEVKEVLEPVLEVKEAKKARKKKEVV